MDKKLIMDQATQLRQACHKVLADNALLPSINKGGGLLTHCNEAVYRIAGMVLKREFFWKPPGRIMLANEICDWLAKNAEKQDTDVAFERAKVGKLVLAAQKGIPHGHVCALYPSPHKVFSGHWSKGVPICANVGKDNGIKGVNFAFSEEPGYFEVA